MTKFSRFPWLLLLAISVFYGCEQLASDYNPDAPQGSDFSEAVQVQLDEPGAISPAIYEPVWQENEITQQQMAQMLGGSASKGRLSETSLASLSDADRMAMLNWIQAQRGTTSGAAGILTDRDLAPVMPLLQAERTAAGLQLDWSALHNLLVANAANNAAVKLLAITGENSGALGSLSDHYFIEVGYRGLGGAYKSVPNNIIRVTKPGQTAHSFETAELDGLVAAAGGSGGPDGKQFVIKLIFGYRGADGSYSGVYGPRIEMHIDYPATDGPISTGYAQGTNLQSNIAQLHFFMQDSPTKEAGQTPQAVGGQGLTWQEEFTSGASLSPLGLSTNFREPTDLQTAGDGTPSHFILDLRGMGYDGLQKRPFNGKYADHRRYRVVMSYPDPNSGQTGWYQGHPYQLAEFNTVSAGDGTGRIRINADELKKLKARALNKADDDPNTRGTDGWENVDISGERYNIQYTPHDYFGQPLFRTEAQFAAHAQDPASNPIGAGNVLRINDSFQIGGSQTLPGDDDPQLVQPEVNGLVYDAMSGAQLTGSTVKVRAGLDAQSGPVLQEELLIGAAYRIQLDAGDYTLEFSANGYITAFLNVTLAAEQILGSQNAELYPREYTETMPGTSVPITFVYVEPGTFEMGFAGGQQSNSGRNGTVTLTEGFYIGKYEVTQAQFEDWAGYNRSSFNASRVGAAAGNHPVETVSYVDAMSLVNVINLRTTNNPYALPTEAQWEWAARGGIVAQQAGEDFLYSGSDDINAVAWWRNNASGRTQPVGTKAPNQLGIYDMSGNVFEWTADAFGSYSNTPKTNPTNAGSTGSSRVLRGGSWIGGSNDTRVAFRYYTFPSGRGYDGGFRLLRAAD